MKISNTVRVLGAFGVRTYRTWSTPYPDALDQAAQMVSHAVWWKMGELPMELRDDGATAMNGPR